MAIHRHGMSKRGCGIVRFVFSIISLSSPKQNGIVILLYFDLHNETKPFVLYFYSWEPFFFPLMLVVSLPYLYTFFCYVSKKPLLFCWNLIAMSFAV